MRLTQVPGLVVAREEVVVHGSDGLQRKVATMKAVVVALPRGVVLVHGRHEQTVGGRRFLGARGTAAVKVVTGDHTPEQIDSEYTTGVQGVHRRVGRIDQSFRTLLVCGEGLGVLFLIVCRIKQAVDLVAADDDSEQRN